MKKVSTLVFFVLWTMALVFPQVAKRILQPVGIVNYMSFVALGENREPSPRPSVRKASPNHVALRALGRRYEAWYNDAFPWRTELLVFHRRMSFNWLKTPVGREVPGYGNWVFRRGGDWAELDDYLGAFELTEDELNDWVVLFEGRREWAHALGSVLLVLPSPVKAQVRWQEIYPAIRRHRGRNVAEQVRKALADSPAREDVLFANDDFEAAFAAGREVFFDADHHPSAYGAWLIYDRLGRRLAELFPGRVGESCPWYDDPPRDVKDGLAPGCWPDRDGPLGDAALAVRLDVSSPGERVVKQDAALLGRRFPYCNVETRRTGGGLSILMAHDSYMRFSLASWRRELKDVRFPFPTGVGHVQAFFFQRFSRGFLENALEKAIPDVLVEQFPECRLDGSAHKYLDENIRAAAAFGRASEPEAGRMPQRGDRIAVRVVLDDVVSVRKWSPSVLLKCGRVKLERRKVSPGVRRVLFFEGIEVPGGELSVDLEACTATKTTLSWRLMAPQSRD